MEWTPLRLKETRNIFKESCIIKKIRTARTKRDRHSSKWKDTSGSPTFLQAGSRAAHYGLSRKRKDSSESGAKSPGEPWMRELLSQKKTVSTLSTDGVTTRGCWYVSGSATAMCLLVEHKYVLWLTCHHLTIVYRVLGGGGQITWFFSVHVSLNPEELQAQFCTWKPHLTQNWCVPWGQGLHARHHDGTVLWESWEGVCKGC